MIIFFVLALVLVLALNLVSAETILDKITGGVGGGDIGKWFKGPGFTKVLFFLLVAFVVYGIAGFMPWTGDKDWVNIGIAIVVSILATFYMSDAEVATILLSYGTLGIVLTGIIPWFAIAAINKKAAEKGYGSVAKYVWLAFVIILVIRIFNADYKVVGATPLLIYGFVGVASFIMFFWGNRIWTRIEVDQVHQKIERHKLMSAAARVAKQEGAKDVLGEGSHIIPGAKGPGV